MRRTPDGDTGETAVFLSNDRVGERAITVEIDREDDRRWIAEVPDLPGVMVYGQTREQAIAKAKALALRVLADRLEHGERVPEPG